MTLMDADDRAFMPDLLSRHEKATDAIGARLSSRDPRGFIEELGARRVAPFRFLDRLDDGGAAAGA